MKPKISLIAAIGKNRELGKNNKLIWDIPEDLRRFKTITSGHPIIMGRKTYMSIGKPLPNRLNIVVTRDSDFKAPGCVVAHSLDEALNRGAEMGTDELFLIGGAQLYKEAIGIASTLYLTIIDHEFDADVFFPAYPEFCKVVSEQTSSHNQYHYRFCVLERC